MRRGQVYNKALLGPEKNMEFQAKSDNEYEVKAIIDSAMYDQQTKNNQMLGLYYLVL